LWTTDLSVVNSDTTKVWNFFLATIDLQVLVNLSIDGGHDCLLNLSDQSWDHIALENWDQNVGNLGHKSTSKCNVNIVWINMNVEFGS